MLHTIRTALFCLITTSTLFAQRVDFTVWSKEETDYLAHPVEIQLEGNKKKVILSDGSKWVLENTVSEAINEWLESDDIRIASQNIVDERLAYIAKNTRTHDAFLVTLTKTDPLADSLEIKKINRKGYGIILSDGSIWVIGYLASFTTCEWGAGDIIAVNKSDCRSYEEYLLINLTRQESVIGTLLSKE